jgi:hypothetical protein
VGAVPSEDVMDVMIEPDLPIFELEDESMKKSPSSLREPLSIACWIAE